MLKKPLPFIAGKRIKSVVLAAPKPEGRAGPTMPRDLAFLAARIKQRRIDCKISQTDLADKIGMSKKTLNNIECERHWPSAPGLISICRALNTGVDAMVNVGK